VSVATAAVGAEPHRVTKSQHSINTSCGSSGTVRGLVLLGRSESRRHDLQDLPANNDKKYPQEDTRHFLRQRSKQYVLVERIAILNPDANLFIWDVRNVKRTLVHNT
jgi:hypothetical protein